MDRPVAACPHPEAACLRPEVCLRPVAVCLRQEDRPATHPAAARRLRAVGRQTAALAAVAVAAQVRLAQSRLHPVKAVAAVDSKVSLAVVQTVVVT